jgi:hypothetical protein
MTMFSVTGGERALTVRYVPLLVWGFLAMACCGVITLVAGMVAGRQPATLGAIGATALLLGFALFVGLVGGELVVATFDRAADLVRIRRYGLRGLSMSERRLSDLAGLEVRVLRRAQHRIELRFRSGERLPLTNYYVVSLNSQGLRRLSALLGVEPTVTAEPKQL